jgi:hypothetical protein
VGFEVGLGMPRRSTAGIMTSDVLGGWAGDIYWVPLATRGFGGGDSHNSQLNSCNDFVCFY